MEILRPLEVESIYLGIASEKTPRNTRRESDPLTTPSKQGIITPVKYNTAKDFALHSGTLLRLDLLGCAWVYIENINVLQTIAQRRVNKRVDRFAQLDRKPVIALVVLRALVVCLVIKKLTAQCQSSIEEIRFSQHENEVLSLRAILDAQPELLARACKARPVEQIEIALREFREADQLVDRAESTTKGERTSPFLLHQNGEIFTARYLRIFRVSFDLCKITEVLQALFGRVHTNRVEDISRRNQNLATNHLVLGACVTGNIDPVHKRAVALLDLIMHIDIAVVLIPLADFVQILLQLHFVQPPGLIEEVHERFAPRLHLFAQHFLAKMLVSLEMDLADRPFHSFVDSENNTRRAAFLIDWIDAKLNADVVVASSLINFDNFLARFLQLLFVYRLVEFQFDFFAQSFRFDLFGSIDFDFAHDRARLDGNDHLHAVAFRLGKDANVQNGAGLV